MIGKIVAGSFAGYGAGCLSAHFAAAQHSLWSGNGFAITGVLASAIVVGMFVAAKHK